MAINQVTYPANLTAQSDFSDHGELIETRYLDSVNKPIWDISGNIPQGAIFQIGGDVYRADSDTAITGTASDYVKITPDGLGAADAAYVADLTGVTWNAQYNGYYDASGNLYVFDEGKALADGEIASVFGRYLMQRADGSVSVGNDLSVAGDADVVGAASVGGALTAATIDTGQGATEVHGMNQSVRTDSTPSFAGITVNGFITPTAGAVLGTVSRSVGSPWVPSRGLYMVVAGAAAELEIYTGSWRSAGYYWAGGLIASDGMNVRITPVSLTTTFYYWRF